MCTKTQAKLKWEERTMRLGKLGPALLAATSLLAAAPAIASAHKHPSPRERCRVNIESIAEKQITAGETATIEGRLQCDVAGIAGGQPVVLYAHSAGTAGFVPVGSTTTEASGAYSLTSPAENTNTSFYVRSHGARSGSKRLRVALQVTLNPLTNVAEGGVIETGAPNQETFTGTISPATADVGARVILQRENAATGEEWHRIGIGSVEAGGTFSIPHIFRVPGDASIRVLVRSDGLNVPSPSNELEYEISQTQNPSLTISSSADPISYGQQVVISGVLAGATTPQTVTLLGRTVHQQGFAPIAEVSTGAGGAYSFPAQAPVNSTLYRVKAGRGEKSAVLYEGVKDVLTAEASPTTLAAGQAVTFSGTVAPDHAGHVIYLERENASGSGFHVVQKGYVLPNSTYSIVHQVYVPGTKVYRIDIPGGPDNGRAVSQPFTIQVTPAAASALTPEAPGNSSLPAEGQTKGSEAETPLSGE
jgi:hypothetical protein